jgi:hypothetical protein
MSGQHVAIIVIELYNSIIILSVSCSSKGPARLITLPHTKRHFRSGAFRVGDLNDLEVRANGQGNDILDLIAFRGQECRSSGIIGLWKTG